MNNLLLNTPALTEAPTRKFSDTLMLFKDEEDTPFAMRAPLDTAIPTAVKTDAEIVYEDEDFSISKVENIIYCSIKRSGAPRAVISQFDNIKGTDTLKAVKSYFSLIPTIDFSHISMSSAFSTLGKLVNRVADYCGCLTDINAPDLSDRITAYTYTRGTPYLAAALPTVCLLYRRLSALRGFNFKLIFPEDLPCLAFSARILGNNIACPADIPEYAALTELDESGGLTVYSRLSEFPDDDGEKIFKFTIILSPQSSDPRGILRAPEWKRKTKDGLHMLDIDIPGRF